MTASPEHGTRACYLRGCRRDGCRDAAYRYMSRYRLDAHRGRPRRTDATPAQERVQQLLAAGWAQAQIATTAGLAHRVVTSLANRENPKVSIRTARAVLAIAVGPPPQAHQVPAVGTARRIRALVAIGWPASRIAPAVGIHPDPLGRIARGDTQHVLASTAKSVADVYRQWSRQPGPSDRARLLAARRGWHGPLAWGDDIDDPAATPDVDGEVVPLDKAARAAAAAEEIRHLAKFGISEEEIAIRVGRSRSYVHEQLAGRRCPGWRGAAHQEAA